MLYTDCIRQCSGPLYVVPAQLPGPLLLYLHSSSSLHWGARGAQLRAQGWGGDPLTGLPPLLSLSLSSRVSASLQDRMVLLVMGNIINWSL